MIKPKTLTGVLHLPDARLHFYLSFDGNGTKAGKKDEGVTSIGRILGQAEKLSPELQEILVKFAEFLEVDLEK